MTAKQPITVGEFAQDFRAEIERLNATPEYNADAGLLVEVVRGQVRVYSGEDDAICCDPEATLFQLRQLEPIRWQEHDNTDTAFEPIWTCICMTGGY